jgi:putative hydrolase of the HAD superfamily
MAEFVTVFDLDDTLYLERDFAYSGFRAAGAWFEETTKLKGLDAACLAIFEAGERGAVFDSALSAIGYPVDPGVVGKLVEIYRRHSPAITLAPDAERYLDRPCPGVRRALISDGRAETQLNKISALGLERWIERVVCTDLWGREFWKPHPRAFRDIEVWSGLPASQLIYIADNCAKDFVTPRTRGWWTVQITRDKRVHQHAAVDDSHRAHAILSSMDGLDECLSKLVRGYSGSPG